MGLPSCQLESQNWPYRLRAKSSDPGSKPPPTKPAAQLANTSLEPPSADVRLRFLGQVV